MDPEKPYGIIYIARNTITGKAYVGQTTKTLEWRMAQHYKSAQVSQRTGSNKHGCRRLSNSINKHGWDAFTWSELATAGNQIELDAREIHHISALGTLSPLGYNLTEGGGGGRKSEETRKRMGAWQIGRKMNPEIVERSRLAQLGKKRGSLKPETRVKLSEAFSEAWIVTHPDGRDEAIRGLREFSEKHSLHISALVRVAQGKNYQHKGFKIHYADRPRKPKELLTRGKAYIVTHPDGRDETVVGLKQFCEGMGLHLGNMVQVARGKNKHCKGYRCRYADQE